MSDIDLQCELDFDPSDSPRSEAASDGSLSEKEGVPPKGKGKAKAKSKASAARGGTREKAGRKKKKGTRECRGCGKQVDIDAMPKGSADCWKCKRAFNCIYNAGVRQGQADWVAEQMDCQRKRRRMLKAYLLKYPDPEEGKKRKTCCVLALKHDVRSESAVDKTRVGEMMWIGHAIHHFQKPKNGSLDADEIKVMFKKKAAAADAIVDQKGPKKAPLRVWFPTKDLVAYRNSFVKAKSYQVDEKTNRKATQEDIDKALSWTMDHHEKAGKASTSLTPQEMGAVLTRSGALDGDGADAFDGNNANMAGGVRDLVSDATESEKEEESEEEDKTDKQKRVKPKAEDSADEDDIDWETKSSRTRSSKQGTPKKERDGASQKSAKSKFFKRDEVVASTLRSLNTWASSQVENAKSHLRTMEQVEKQIGSDERVRSIVQFELTIMEKRKTCLQMILDEGDQASSKLLSWIADVEAAAKASSNAARVGAGDAKEAAALARQRMGAAPPCRSFKHLKTMAGFHDMKDGLHLCNTKEEVDSLVERLKPTRDAINELCVNVNAALSSLKSCVNAAQKKLAEKQEDGASRKKKAARRQGGKILNALVEHGPGLALEVPHFPLGAQGVREHLRCSRRPLLIKLPKDCEVLSPVARSIMDSFVVVFQKARGDAISSATKKFNGDPKAAKPESVSKRFRVSQPAKGKPAKVIDDLVDQLFQDHRLVPTADLPAKLRDLTSASCFGISSGYEAESF